MRKSNKNERRLFLLFAVVSFPAMGIAPATTARSQPETALPVAKDATADQEIPTGFNLDRYAPVWERNPFTLVAPTAVQAPPSVFDKLFLTSWLKDGRTDVVFIQNVETNEVQRITANPNQDNLRLIALHPNSNPKLVEALISDGKEQGLVKFHFDAQPPVGQAASPVAQMTNAGTVARGSNPNQAVSAPVLRPLVNPLNAQNSSAQANAPVDQPLTGRAFSGSGTTRMQGGSKRGPRRQGSEGVQLPAPQASGQSIPGKG